MLIFNNIFDFLNGEKTCKVFSKKLFQSFFFLIYQLLRFNKTISDEGVVKAIGEVRRIGNSKIVSVTCRLDPEKFKNVHYIMWWVIWWRPKAAKTYGLIAGKIYKMKVRTDK